MLLEPKIEQLILLNLGKKWTKNSRDGLVEIANCKRYWLFVLKSRSTVAPAIVVTTGIKPSSNIGSALVSAMYRRSSELGLYLWGN